MKSLIGLVFLVALFSLACKSKTQAELPKQDDSIELDLTSASSGEVYFVSMIKLLANPDKYNGKKVMVEGYLNLEFEGNGLYFHKEDYNNGMSKNALWVDLNKPITAQAQKCKLNYVIIEATFDGNQGGHMDAYSGTLKDVTRVDITTSGK